jgi:spermidine synthase
MLKNKKSFILKSALFATGLSGIVAEYILSTLATYFLGNSVLQWTLILSTMLFTMGLGSRISKYFTKNLLEKFIIIEMILSLLVSFCAIIAYGASAYSSFNTSVLTNMVPYSAAVIYTVSALVGLMIGMEIPLVTRLNEEFESLKINISSVMEKDYYGSLVGGIFFAFVGLPYLGLTYTPFVLGGINFLVAIILFFQLKYLIDKKYKFGLILMASLTFILITTGAIFSKNIINYGEQRRYKDPVIFQTQTAYQRIVLTQWKNEYWLYLNGNQQLSTLDEHLYHEPLVHPVMNLSKNPQNILILGGGDGCAAREVLKYESVKSITLVDLDPAMTDLGKNHPVFQKMNNNSFSNPKVEIINGDAFNYLENHLNFYDVIIIDFPDPKNIEINRLYTLEFYKQTYRALRPNGVLITQSGSPYYATRAFKCIEHTISAANFTTIPLHNQVLTMGEWGWVIGTKSIPKETLKPILKSMKFEGIETRWINHDAMQLITSFGKDLIKTDSTQVNTIHNPVLYRYYEKGNWDLY